MSGVEWWVFVFISQAKIGKAQEAYSDLCSRWICEDVALADRPAHQRLFQVLFAAPLFGSLGLALAIPAGVSVSAFFAAALIMLALASVCVALTARNAPLGLVLAFLMSAILVLGAVSTVIFGAALALPLALIAAGDTYFILRNRLLAVLGALAALMAVLLVALATGNTESGTGSAMLGIVVTLLHGVAMLSRNWSVPNARTASPSIGNDAILLDADGVVRVDMGLSGEVCGVTGNCANTLGMSSKRLEGFGLYERILVADRLLYLSALDDIRTGRPKAALSVRLRNDAADSAYLPVDMIMCLTDQKTLALSIRSQPACDQTGHTRVLERAPMPESEIKADRYLASVSHELRTPLNAILGFSDILKQEMFGALANDRQREYVGLIHESGSHLLSVVNMILDMSKIDMGAYQIIAEAFDVEDAASMSIAMIKEQAAKKHITIATELDQKAAECTGDRRAVQQILINLLSNAVKFTPDGGCVTLTTQEENGYLVMKVCDTGIGISAEDLDRIGQPFFQVQNDYTRTFEGTGLGLSLVRGLVELHAGGLSIESEPGVGTDVIVRLPIAGPAKARRADLSRLEVRKGNKLALTPEKTGSTTEGAGNEPTIRKTA